VDLVCRKGVRKQSPMTDYESGGQEFEYVRARQLTYSSAIDL